MSLLVLVAHGTRRAAGVQTVRDLAAEVGRRLAVDIPVCFVDVLGPTPAELLRTVDGPVVLVPAFLAAGYHVRTDVPRGVVESGHPDVRVTPALGPDPALAQVAHDRLVEAGWAPGDRVVLAAAGSSDPRALGQVGMAAVQLAELVGSRVTIGYAATARPTVAQAVANARAAGASRVAVAAWFLAPGRFHDQLGDAGADVVAAPLAGDTRVVDLVLERYRSATVPAPPALV